MHLSYLSLEFKKLTFGCINVRINIGMEINSHLPGHLCLFTHKIPSDIPFFCEHFSKNGYVYGDKAKNLEKMILLFVKNILKSGP
jgi:hypothetical protein